MGRYFRGSIVDKKLTLLSGRHSFRGEWGRGGAGVVTFGIVTWSVRNNFTPHVILYISKGVKFDNYFKEKNIVFICSCKERKMNSSQFKIYSIRVENSGFFVVNRSRFMAFSRKSTTTVVTDVLLQFLMRLTMVVTFLESESLGCVVSCKRGEWVLIAVNVYKLYLDIIVDKRC